MGGAGQPLAADDRYFRGIRTINRDQDNPADRCGVSACIYDDVSHTARRRLQRRIAKIGTRAIKIPERKEACHGVGVRSARRPEIRGKESHTSENAQVIRLGDGARDVIEAAVLIFGYGKLHARIAGVNLALQMGQNLNSLAAGNRSGDPGILDKGRIPQAARTLNDGLSLGVGKV